MREVIYTFNLPPDMLARWGQRRAGPLPHERAQSFIKYLHIRAIPQCRESQIMKATNKSDPNLLELILELKRETREGGAAVWRDIAKRLEKPRRNWAEVNLSRLDRYADEGDVVVVPGKVLGAGKLSKSLTVAAYGFSGSASRKIEEAGGKNLTIQQLVQESPDGSGVRIFG